ncbi:Glycosyl phosphatidyl inositol anchor synthesis [Colletotrichum noveboracense]|nr:Glycosyl phosphatidyl inositol anchor synthesis [Colletotrichum noveboracense]
MAVFSRAGFLAIALVFHVVYIYSIFDIYFVSPIVSGMQLVPIERPAGVKPPADRLVLFVGDGLRADKAFQSFPDPYPKTEEDLEPKPLAPFLRSRVLEHGTFGVSHTRVPTESRPGHVALIAGLYEDVSAVATGWKLNPVNFDSVFNRSRHTWSWGSPDILPMFETGAVPGRVDSYTYGHEFEDFSSDALELDYWVFDHVKDFFAEAARNETLNAALRQDKIVFFLHLLGLDTSGHSYRPYSKEYLRNIQVVDQGVQKITELIDGFYADDRTAFVFTADHGMSDWGSHGDGHPNNTRTPLITWGSGIAPPVLASNATAPGHDEYSSDWHLDHVKRHDVAQADVAALMAYLVGVEFPANSVGEIPLSYVSSSIEDKAEAALVNAREILEMYRVKEERKKATELRYRPFHPLSEAGLSPQRRVVDIRRLIEAGNHEEAIEESAALMKIALEGLRYLQTYDWLFLRTLITIGYLGWMAFAMTIVIDLHVLRGNRPASRTLLSTTMFSSLLAALYASFIISHSPLTYYAYAFFPIVFWEEVWARRGSLVEGRQVLFGHIQTGPSAVSFLLNGALYIGVIVSLALGYIHREILTVIYILGSLWPATWGLDFLQANAFLSATWFMSCLAMSTFTLLPAMKVEDVSLIVAGGVIMASIGLAYLVWEDVLLARSSTGKVVGQGLPIARALTGIQVSLFPRLCIDLNLTRDNQVGLILLAIVVTRSSALSLQAKLGLPRGNQIVGWIVLGETILLVAWVSLEHRIFVFGDVASEHRQPTSNGSAAKSQSVPQPVFRALTLADARVALFFFVLLQSAFFSTGNVASVSSFSLDAVYRLIPIFDPFSQGILLILKLMIPFALISANLGILNARLGVAPSSLFMAVMAISDVLTLYFFWVVKDEGSWLEIGSTISHFVIANVLCLFVASLEGVSALFIGDVEVEGRQGRREQKQNGTASLTYTEAPLANGQVSQVTVRS